MTYIYISIIILLAGVLVWPKGREKAVEKAVGIGRVALGQSRRKEERKGKILKLLQERGELSNSGIREATGLHRRSVQRYLDELEEAKSVEQVGDTGRGVKYRLK